MTTHTMVLRSIAALLFLACPQVASQAPAFSLADVAWMQGHWIMERNGGRAEEIWMAPLDGSMVGSFRWAVPGQMHVLEFLIIEQQGSEVTFRFKHFHRDYRAWEDSPNSYRLIRIEDGKATFENVAWNGRVPKAIIYSQPSPERLTFRGESPDGAGESLVLEFHRAR